MARVKKFTDIVDDIFGWFQKKADAIYNHSGVYINKWLRLFFAIIFDFLDIASRILFIIIRVFCPIVTRYPNRCLDIALTFMGTILWGSVGLLQMTEVILESEKHKGVLVDFLPMLTISGIIFIKTERGD